jgi:dihydrofolate reductase (trimethoprim resistance protein)
MKKSIIAAVSENGVIGSGPNIPWNAMGEQLLFKAITFNQWLLVGRITFESMGILPDRKFAVVSSSTDLPQHENVMVFPSIDKALQELPAYTDHVFVTGGGQIFSSLINEVDTIHLSTIHLNAKGDVYFPEIPQNFKKVFSQFFPSNINYTYEIWNRV